MGHYIPTKVRVDLKFRDTLTELHPSLVGTSKQAEVYRRIAEHALLGQYKEGKGDDAGKRVLLLGHDTLAGWKGVHRSNNDFRSGRELTQFSSEVFPLNASKYHTGKKRTLSPTISLELAQAKENLLPETLDALNYRRVDLVTGEGFSRREYERWKASHTAELELAASGSIPMGHPIEDYIHWLNAQPSDCLWGMLKNNWKTIRDFYFNMPCESMEDWLRKDAAFRILLKLQDQHRIFYKASENSTRIYNVGTTILQLPRDVRKVALTGSIQLDLKAAQLAIVSKLWHLPALHEFLSDRDRSIWQELFDWLGAANSPENKKSIKQVVYGIIFGMKEGTIVTHLNKKFGKGSGRRFLKHPLVTSLLAARKERMVQIRKADGVEDAFGIWTPLEPKKTKSGKLSLDAGIRGLLAQEVQSYEVQVMTSMFPVIQSEQDIRVLAFLHDGCALHIGDKSERERKLRRLRKAVDDTAASMDFPTWLELE